MQNRNYEQISLIRPYYDLYSGTRIGVLVINIDKYVMKNIVRRDSDTSNIVIDKNNHHIIRELSESHHGLLQKLDELTELAEQDSGDIIFSLGREKQILVFSTSEYTGWKFISVIPASASMQQMNQLRDSILILFLMMNIITAVVLIVLMSEKVFRKVNKLIISTEGRGKRKF